MNDESKVFPCLVCLAPAMRCRVDRKGGLYWYCGACSSRLFTRAGHVGLFNVAGTLKLLANEKNLAWVRKQGFEGADDYAKSVADLLSPSKNNKGARTGGPPKLPAGVVLPKEATG